MANEFKIKKGLIVEGASGGTVVDIQGSQGRLFSVTDDLSGSIFAVSDISGVPIFDVNSSGLSTFSGTINADLGIVASGAMSTFETTLTNNDDWENSPISINERGNVGNAQTADKYAPNLNFHWGGIVSNSLWLGSDGQLNYGSYSATGIPTSDGRINANIFGGELLGTINTATTGTTQTAGNNSTLIATTAYADAAAAAVPIGNYLPLSAGSSYPLTNSLYLENTSGSAGASPSLYFKNGSANFWRYLHESDGDFSIKEGTSTRLTFEAGGNVGIGTTSPDRELEVEGNGNVYIRVTASTDTDSSAIELKNTQETWTIKNADTNDDALQFESDTVTALTILKAGNVGIGTNSPGAKLHIANEGEGEFAGGNSSSAGGSHLMLKDEGSTSRTLMSGPSVVFQTPANADGTNVWATSRVLGSPAAAGSARGTISLQVRDQYDPLSDGTSWNWRTALTAINTGNVGIGTNAPLETLSVPSGEGAMFGFKRFYSDTGQVPAGVGSSYTLTAKLNKQQGTTLTTKFQYKFYLTTTGTGTYNSSVYIVYRNSGDTAWNVHRVSSTGLTSNNPELTVSGNNALIYNDHPSTYNVNYRVETSYTGQAKTSPQIFGSDYMWTRDSTDLYYMDGDVGIGVSDPAFKLDVAGAIQTTGSLRITTANPGVIFKETDITDKNWDIQVNNGNLKFYEVNDARSVFNEHLTLATGGNLGVGFTSPQAAPISSMKLSVNGNTYVSGNVGIGTTSPSQKLHVSDGGIRVEKFATGLGGFISVGNATETAGNYSAYYFGNTLNDTGYFKGGIAYETLSTTHGRGDMHFLQRSDTGGGNANISHSVMTILNVGDVGIGTTTPSAKLDVQGTQGQLFSVTDDLSGDIFSVADISGVPIMNVNSDGTSYFDGNVGINNSSPTAKLEITGDATVDETAQIIINSGGVDNNSIIRFTDDEAGQICAVGTLEGNILTHASCGDIQFKTNNGNITGNTDIRMFINQSGNVGIGTVSPNAKLNVNGNIKIEGTSSLSFGGSGSVPAWGINSSGNNLIIDDQATTSGDVLFNNNGSVGIGTTTPSDKLHVNGTVRSQAPASSDWGLLSFNSSGTSSSGVWFSSGSGQLMLRRSDNSLQTKIASAGSSYINGGNLGLGTTTPAQKLTVNSGRILITNNTTPFYIKVNSGYKSWVHHIAADDGYIFAPSTVDGGETWDWAKQTKIQVDGAVRSGNFILSSDERIKTKIKDLTCDNINVNWKSFEIKGNEGEYRAGVIAQELEKSHPEFVNTDVEGFKSVKYIDLLIAKIAELEARLEKLEK